MKYDSVNTTAHNIILKNKNVLISGGTTGIGRATALLLASHGSNLIIFGRHQKELNDTMNDLEAIGQKNVVGLNADTSTREGLIKVYKKVDNHFNGLDIFINNAALGGGNLFKENFNNWKYLIDTNILGYLSFAQYAADRMEKQGSGHIVNIGSMSAEERESGNEVYVATKAAIRGFSESLRKSVNTKGIKVTLIEPGAVGTDMQPISPKEQRRLQMKGKMLMAEDIAQAILYCLTQPERSDVIVLQIQPHLQTL